MDKKILKNYLFNILYQVVIIAVPFLMTPYLQQVFAPATLGINTWVTSNVQWFVIIGSLGISVYGNREIARVRDDKEHLSKTFSEIYRMQFTTMGIAFLLYFISIFFVADKYKMVSIIQIMTLVSVALDITWFFYGVEDFKKASIRNILVKLVGVVLIFLFVKTEADFYLFVIINGATAIAGQLIMWFQLRQYVRLVKVKWSDVVRHIKPNLILFVPQLAINIYSNLPTNMLGYLSSDDQVQFYQVSQQFVKMFLFFITSIGSVMLPRLSNIHAKNQKEEFHRFLIASFKMATYLAIPLMAGICAVIPFFVPWFMEPEYAIATTLITYLSPIVLFISISNVYGTQYLLPVGRMREYSLSVVCGAVANFSLNLMLMPIYGAYGAVISTLVAEAVVAFVQWIFVRKNIGLSFQISEVIKYIIASCVMGVIIYFVGLYFPASSQKLMNLLKNLIQVGLGLVIYFVTLVILKSSFQKDLVNKVIREVKNRGKN